MYKYIEKFQPRLRDGVRNVLQAFVIHRNKAPAGMNGVQYNQGSLLFSET